MRDYSIASPILLASSICAVAAVSPALAQDDAPAGATSSGDIVVTAQRREELLRDVPMSVTALNADMLDKAGVGNLQDLERVTPGLALPTFGGFLRPSIRGISSGISAPGDSSNIAIYVDGVYQPTQSSAIVDLPDVQSVQVLKGPQGTLYGQNATGGAMIIDTLSPQFDFGGELAATYGNYDKKAVRGYITGPLSQNVAFIVSAAGEDRGGFNRDLLRGGHDKGLRSYQVRGKLLFEVSDKTSFTLSGHYANRKDSNIYASTPLNGNALGNALTLLLFPGTPVASKPHTFATNVIPDLPSETYGASLTGKIGIGDIGTLNTVTAYQNAKAFAYGDIDGAPVSFLEINPNKVFSRAIIQELNFVSEKFGRFSFSAGGFYMNRREKFAPSQFGFYANPLVNWDAPAGSGTLLFESYNFVKSKKQSYAGYAELSYDITDQLSLTLAGRYSYEKVLTSNNNGAPPKQEVYFADPRGYISFKKFTPRAVLRYKPNEDHMFYASYSKGFKSGYVDVTDFTLAPVKPETVSAFEIGYKGRIGSQLDVAISAFHYKYNDIQVFIYRLPTGFYQNAAAAKLNGFDFDLNWKPAPGLTLTAGGSYVDSKFTNFQGASVLDQLSSSACAAQFLPFPCGNQELSADVTGNQLANAPKFTGTTAVDYRFDTSSGRIGVNVNGNYNSGFPFDVGGHIRQQRYMLVNAELSFEPAGPSGLRLSLWGKNLSNHDYLAGTLTLFASDLAIWAPPRTYGITAEYRF